MDIITNPDDLSGKKKGKPSQKSSRHGYKFESEIMKSLKRLEDQDSRIYYEKMVDTYAFDWIKSLIKELVGIIKEIQAIPEVREVKRLRLPRLREILSTMLSLVLPKVPADMFVLTKGRAVFIECKSSQRKSGFNPFPPYIKEHQIQASREITLAGVPYYFFVCNRVTPRHHYMLVITGYNMRRLMRILEQEGKRKSMPWPRMEEFALHRLEKQKGGSYDLSFLLGK